MKRDQTMRRLVLAAAAVALIAHQATAETSNVGLIATLSGQSAGPGQQTRNGVTLALFADDSVKNAPLH